MGQIELHPDFKDFLRLLNSHGVEYLVVGGYAVGYYGYPWATGDMDIWVAVSDVNAEKSAQTLRDFGLPEEEAIRDLFIKKDKMIRMGIPPIRIAVITGASGINFEECYLRREVIDIDDIPVNFIALEDLKTNKQACGRYKDLEDLQHVP